MIQCLLGKCTVRTQKQLSSIVAIITIGVPQGDPFSPWLFNLFLDVFLEVINQGPSRVILGFADDVLVLTSNYLTMSIALDSASDWAEANRMTWNASKSCIMGPTPPGDLYLSGSLLHFRSTIVYLGVSLTYRGVSHHRLVSRITTASWKLHSLREGTSDIHLSIQQRRALVKSFILPLTDYVLYLQPLHTEVQEASRKLENSYLQWILNQNSRTAFSQGRMRVARTLLSMPSLITRRHIQAVRVLGKFKTAARYAPRSFRSDAQHRAIEYYGFLQAYSTLRKTSMELELPDNVALVAAKCTQAIDDIRHQAFVTSNQRWTRHIPWEPTGPGMPPVLRSQGFSPRAQRLATHWYLSKLVPTPATRPLFPQLRVILERARWSDSQEREAQAVLEALVLAHDRRSEPTPAPGSEGIW